MKHLMTICASEQDDNALASTWQYLRGRGWQVSDAVERETGFAVVVISKESAQDLRWQKQVTAVLSGGIPMVKLLKTPGAMLPEEWERALLPYRSLLYVRQDPGRLHGWLKKQAAALPCLTEQWDGFVLCWTTKERCYNLHQGIVRLGSRKKSCHICIENHIGVSREHAELKIADGHCCLQDLGSANGTTINGRCIEPKQWVPLYPGDWFALDDQQFLLKAEG